MELWILESLPPESDRVDLTGPKMRLNPRPAAPTLEDLIVPLAQETTRPQSIPERSPTPDTEVQFL